MIRKSEFENFNLYKIGTTFGLTGIILSGEGRTVVCPFPDSDAEPHDPEWMEMTLDEWKTLVKQTDLMETEIIAMGPDQKLTKIILRKCQRVIDHRIKWKVFRRDNYSCRYCGRDDIPLTVDHLVLWEEGGPSTVENMTSACKKCNKTRGSMQYADWLESKYYKRVSKNLAPGIYLLNQEILPTLEHIPRKKHVRSKR